MKTNKRLLIIEDDLDLVAILENFYRTRNFEVQSFSDPQDVLDLFEKDWNQQEEHFDIMLIDLNLPHINGIEFIRKLKEMRSHIPMILMTADSSIEVAVDAIKSGAYDFVSKPINFTQLSLSIERALHVNHIEMENRILRSSHTEAPPFVDIVSKSEAMKKIFELGMRVAKSTANILISGESGTGKEVLAKFIHQNSHRKDKNFVAINCSAIPENLLESELFGYAKGAFTGAAQKKIGLFEEANGGTLLLDEIGDLDLVLQAKLLRVIQERKIKRVGENKLIPVDVRILAATHKDLEAEVHAGRFREDLFFRLNVILLHVPPLRRRKEDILPLAKHFLNKYSEKNQVHVLNFTKEAEKHLIEYPWNGNVRELENAIERAVILCGSNIVGLDDLPKDLTPKDFRKNLWQHTPGDNLPTLEEVSLQYISYVLESVNGVKEHASRILNIDRKTLYRKLDDIKKGPPGGGPKHNEVVLQ